MTERAKNETASPRFRQLSPWTREKRDRESRAASTGFFRLLGAFKTEEEARKAVRETTRGGFSWLFKTRKKEERKEAVGS